MNKNKILKSNIGYGFIWKILSLVFSYLTIPYLLNYLGEEYYGVWVTFFSILNVAFLMDLGISLGLKNKLTQCIANKDIKSAKSYISTAYFTLILFSILIIFIGVIILYNLDYQLLLNTNKIEAFELKCSIIICFILMIISITISLYKNLFLSYQKSAIIEFSVCVYQFLILLQFIILPYFIEKSLIVTGLVYGISNLLIGIVFTILFFKKNIMFIPKIKNFDKNKLNDLFGLGLNFFIIQLCLIIIFSTDNYIVTRFINPEATTSYSIVYKLYQPLIVLSTFILTPMWTLYTNAFEKNDFIWIKTTFKKFNLLFLLLIGVVIILSINLRFIVSIWIPKKIDFDNTLIILMAVFVLIKIYGDIYMTFINGIGEIKLQMYLYIIAAFLNIPLSILFIKYFNLGSAGVILASSICMLILTVIMPVQALNILNKKMKNR